MTATDAPLLPDGLSEADVESLPGAELVLRGLADLAAGRATREALLASLAIPSLRLLGWSTPAPLADPERDLYRLLDAEHGDAAHGRYNALVRRVVSFQRAAAHASRWANAS